MYNIIYKLNIKLGTGFILQLLNVIFNIYISRGDESDV